MHSKRKISKYYLYDCLIDLKDVCCMDPSMGCLTLNWKPSELIDKISLKGLSNTSKLCMASLPYVMKNGGSLYLCVNYYWGLNLVIIQSICIFSKINL